MNKEKTIHDPPAHIKKIIDDEFEDLKDTSEYPFSSRVSYRAGATFMYHRSEEELEERSVGFTEWIAKKRYRFFWHNGIEGWYSGDTIFYVNPQPTFTSQDLYARYLESLNH